MPSQVRVVSRRTVKPSRPRPRERIPLSSWDVSMLNGDYPMNGLFFAPPPFSTGHLIDHLHAALADALATYYPVAGRFATEQHHDDEGNVVGCSVYVDCAGQGVHMVHAAADGVAIADVVPPDADADADIPRVVHSLFPLYGAVNYEGHGLPLFAVQVTELTDGVFLGFTVNHALSDGIAWWDFFNAWAEIAQANLAAAPLPTASRTRAPPSFERWSADGRPAAPAVIPYADLASLMEREKEKEKERPSAAPPLLRGKMLHFSAGSLSALKERARQELLQGGDKAGAAAVTRFHALSSLLWRCVTRARRLQDLQQTVCRFAINHRGRLLPPLPAEYFGNTVYAQPTEAVSASELLARGHGWAAATVGRVVAAHTDATIQARVAAWTAKPTVSLLRLFDPTGLVIAGSPRFDVYGCDFGWGKPLAARSGNANLYDGKVMLFPGREGGGSIDVELTLTPEHMAALEQDAEFWAVVSLDADQTTAAYSIHPRL